MNAAAVPAGLEYHVLDVFTDRALSGNPLAVVLGAAGLDTARLQAIAAEFNLSETVFVLPPSRAGALVRARIFTPARELPFAGHPTVGTACLLAELGIAPAGEVVDIVLDEAVGPVPVRIRRRPSAPIEATLTTAVLPVFAPAPPVATLASRLGVRAGDIETVTDAPREASCGVPFILVPLRSLDALARARLQPAPGADSAASFYLYHPLPDPAATLRTRMFAPDLGVGEDPATGSAAAALCGHLADRDARTEGRLAWTLRQGVEMGRPSRLDIEADKQAGAVCAVRVGGSSVRVAAGRLLL